MRSWILHCERFRDPRGWLLDALPWPVRRLYFACIFRELPWSVPNEVRLVGCRRPPRYVFDYFRKLHGLDEEPRL